RRGLATALRSGRGEPVTTPQHPTARPFDTRPLTEPVDRAAVKEFARQLRASGALSSRFSSTLMIVFVVAFVVIFLVVGGVISSVTLAIAASGGVLGYTPLLML